jgi:hypothetical protein
VATDGKTPKPCDPKIFKKGTCVAMLDGSSNRVEHWVRSVAKKANAKVDWHYAGGRAMVLHLGDSASYTRTLEAIKELAPPTMREIDYDKYESGQLILLSTVGMVGFS